MSLKFFETFCVFKPCGTKTMIYNGLNFPGTDNYDMLFQQSELIFFVARLEDNMLMLMRQVVQAKIPLLIDSCLLGLHY